MRRTAGFNGADFEVVIAWLKVIACMNEFDLARFAGDGVGPSDGVPGDFVRLALGHGDGRGGLEGGCERLMPAVFRRAGSAGVGSSCCAVRGLRISTAGV